VIFSVHQNYIDLFIRDSIDEMKKHGYVLLSLKFVSLSFLLMYQCLVLTHLKNCVGQLVLTKENWTTMMLVLRGRSPRQVGQMLEDLPAGLVAG